MNKNAVETSLTLEDNSKTQTDLFGKLQVSLPNGKKFMMSQNVKEDESGEFTSTTNAGLGKSVNTIITLWKKSQSSLKLASDISLNNYEPISFSGEYGMEQNTYKAAASVAKGSSKYIMLMSSKSETGSVQASVDVSCPTRRVIGNFEGTLVDNKYTGRAELRWDANRDDTKRAALFANGQFDSLSNIDGSFSFQYPSRTISINMRQTITSKYSSHLDFSWEPNETFAIDTTFGTYGNANSKEMIGSFKLSTPYQGFRSIDLSANQQINDGAFITKVDMKWDDTPSVSGTMTLKRPLSISNINAEFIAKAPVYGLKSIHASLIHRLNKGLKTQAELAWNKQSVQVGLRLIDSSDEHTTNVKGQMDIKSSIGPVTTVSLTAEHVNDGRRIDTNAVLQYDKKSYGLISSVRGTVWGWNLKTNGDISLTLPTHSLAVNWNHKNTFSEITSSAKLDLDGKTYTMNLNGLQEMTLPKGSMSISGEINGLGIQINHNHDSNQLDSSVSLLRDSATVTKAEAKYQNENGKITSKLTMTNPVYSGADMVVTLAVDTTKKPVTGQLEMFLSPQKKIVVSGSLLSGSVNKPDFEITANVLLPNIPIIAIRVTQKQQQYEVAAALSVKYDNDKEIRLETVRRNDNRKELQLKFISPYTQDISAAAMYSLKKNQFETSGRVEAQPYLGEWSMNGLVDFADSVSGNIRINTPYRDMSYSQISFGSTMIKGDTNTSLNIEYIPGKTINLQSTTNIKSMNDFSVTAEVSTPFEIMTYSKATVRFNGDNSRLSQFGELEYPAGQKTSVETNVLITTGITGTLTIKSPYTSQLDATFGYEPLSTGFQAHIEGSYTMKVRVEMRHEGTMDAFTTSGKLMIDENNYTGTMRFQLQPNVLTSLSFETPSQSITLSNNFDGTNEKFSNELKVLMSKYGTYAATINVNVLSSIDISASIQTPINGFKNLKTTLNHAGDWSRFLTHVEIQSGDQTYIGNIDYNTNTAFNFAATFKTPIPAFKILRLALHHEGIAQNFKLHGEFQRNKELTEVDLFANTLKKWDIDFTLRCPYTDTVKVSLDHWGKLSKFQTKLTASFGSIKIRSNAKFQTNPSVSGLFSIRSPLQWLKSQQLIFKHSGNVNSFKIDLKYLTNGKTYTGDISFQNLNSLKGEMNIKGPSFESIKASLSHEGRPQNFKSAASVSMGHKAIDVNANVNMVNGVKGNVEVATPFDDYRTVKAVVSHAGDYSKFDSHGEIAVNKQRGQLDMSYDSTQDLTGSLSLTTPFIGWKDLSSSFKHVGNAQSFSTSGHVSKDGHNIDGHMSLNNEEVMTGSASVKSTIPAIDNYEASFSHKGSFSKFSSNAEVVSGKSRHAATVDFSSQNGYDGNLKFDSPLMRNAELKFKHSMSNTSLNSDISVGYDGDKQYGLRADMTTEPSMTGLFTITSPHDGYESSELALHHNGDNNGFRSKGAFKIFGENYEIEAGFSPVPDMNLFLTFKSPLFEDIRSTLSYEGHLTRFHTRYEMTYGKASQIQIDSSLNVEGPIAGDFKYMSPHTKNLKASFSHSGDLESFTTDGQVTFAGQTTMASVYLRTSPRIETSLSFSSPFSKDARVVFSLSGPITRSQTAASVTYGRNSLFDLESTLSINRNLKADLKMTSVLTGCELIGAKLSKDGDMNDLVFHVEATLNDAVVSGDLTFANNKGSITIKAPFMETVFGTFDISNYNLLQANANTKLTYGSRTLFDITSQMHIPDSADITILLSVNGFERSTFSFKRTADIGGHFMINVNGLRHEADAYMNTGREQTFFVALDSPELTPMSTSIHCKRTGTSMTANGVMAYGNEKVEVEVEYRIQPDVFGRVTLKTPYFELIELKTAFEGQSTNFKSSAAVSYGKNINEISGSLNIEDTIQGQVAIKSPLMVPIDIRYDHTGSFNDFSCIVIVVVDSDRHTMDASYKFDNTIEATFNMQSATFGSTNGFVRLDGEPTDFEADFEFGRENVNTKVKGTFKLQDEIKGTFEIDSPYNTMRGSYSVTGSLQNFRSDAAVTIDGQLNSGKLHFNMETSNFLDIDINVANMTPFKVTAQQTGTISNSRTTLKLVKDTVELVSSELTFTQLPMEGRFYIRTPLQGYEIVTAVFAHKGNMLNFNTHAELNINGDKSDFDMTFNMKTRKEGTISITSPYFPAVNMEFDMTEDIANSHRAEFTYGQSKYAMDTSLQVRPQFDFSLKVQTPLNGFETITAILSHNGDPLNFRSKAKLDIAGDETELDVTFNLETSKECSLRVTSPYFPTIGLKLESIVNGDKSERSAEITVGKDTYFFDTTIELKPDLELRFKMQTPVTGYESVAGLISYSGDVRNFKNHAEFVIRGEKTEYDFDLNLKTSKEGTLSIKSPYFRLIDMKFLLTGNDEKYHSLAEFTYGHDTYAMEIFVEVAPKLELSMKLQSPLSGYETVSAMISHTGESNNFGNHAELVIGGEKTEFDITMNIGHSLQGTLGASSPYFKTVSSKLSFEGNGRKSLSKAELTVDQNTYSLEVDVDTSAQFAIGLNIQTPFVGYETVTAKIAHDGKRTNFRNIAELAIGDSKTEFDIVFDLDTRKEGAFSMRSPYFSSVGMKFDLTGNRENVQGRVECTYGQQTIALEADLVTEPQFQLSLKLETPITGYKTVTAMISHTGAPMNFKNHAELIINGEKTEFDMTFNIGRKLEGTISANSPYFPSVGAKIGFAGNGGKSQSQVELTYGQNTYMLEADLDTRAQFALSLKAQTPFSGYETVDAMVSHVGDALNFKSHGELVIAGDKTEIDMTINIATRKDGKLSIRSPYFPDVGMNFELTGNTNKSQSRAEFTYGKDTYALETNVEIWPKVQMSLKAHTPITGYETVTATFSHTGEALNFRSLAQLDVSGDKSEFDLTFNLKTHKEGRLNVYSPYLPAIGVNFNFGGNIQNCEGQAEIIYGEAIYAVEVDMKARSNIELNIKVQTPFKAYTTVTATITHSGSFPNINSFAQVKTARRNLMTCSMILSTSNTISAKLSAQSIFTPAVQLTFDHSGDLTSFKTNGEVRVDDEPNTFAMTFQTVPTLTGSMSVHSFLIVPVSASFVVTPQQSGHTAAHIEGSMFGKSVSGDLKYEPGKLFTASATTPFDGYERLELSANVRNQYKAVSVIAEMQYPSQKISFTSNLNWRNGLTGSISLNTPENLIGLAKADFSWSGELSNMQSTIKVEVFGQTFSVNGELENKNRRTVNLNIVTPFKGYEHTGVSFTSEGYVDDLNVNFKVFYMGKEIVYTLQNTRNGGRLETKSRLETPYTEDFTFDMLLTGTLDNFYHTVSLSMGVDSSVALQTTSKINSAAVSIESTLKTSIAGYTDEQKLTVNYEGQLSFFKASATAKVFDRIYTVESDVSMNSGISAHLKINTPVQYFRDIDLKLEHDGNYRRFSTKAELQYATNKKIDAHIQFLNYGLRRLETSIEVNTPLVTFETTKASYRHAANYDGFECDISATVMNKDVTGTLRATRSPMSMSLAVTTPFEGFEQVGSDMRLIQGPGRVSAQANVRYMQDKVISVSSDMTIEDSVSGTIKMTTPFSGFETTELIVSQTGSLDDFQAIMSVDSPITTPISAQANMRYRALTNMDGTMTFTSQIENFENLKFSINNEALRQKYNSKVEMTWAPGKAITLDGTFTDNSYASSADVTLRTPFESIRQANINTRMGMRGNVYTNKATVEYNSKVVTDFDISLDLSARKSLTYTMRTPVATMIKMEGEMSDKYDAGFTFSPFSDGTNGYKFTGNFDPSPKRLSFRYNDDKSSDISFDGTMNQMNVNAYGDRYGYDTSYDSRTKYVKVILPHRSLLASLSQMAGTTEGKFMWDADRDDTKQIGFRSQLTPSQDSVKADITVIMPSIGKVKTINIILTRVFPSLLHCIMIIIFHHNVTYNNDKN